jgi:hypothetical protein
MLTRVVLNGGRTVTNYYGGGSLKIKKTSPYKKGTLLGPPSHFYLKQR